MHHRAGIIVFSLLVLTLCSCSWHFPQTLDSSVSSLSLLTSLDLASNELEELPAGIGALKKLQHIKVHTKNIQIQIFLS